MALLLSTSRSQILESTTSISSLPVELLVQILSIHTTLDSDVPDVVTYAQTSLVCHYWRSICLDIARFWTAFEACPCKMCRAYFARWIGSRKGTPIDIYVGERNLESHGGCPGWSAGDTLRDMLLPHLQRIRSFTINPSSNHGLRHQFHYPILGILTGAGVPLSQLQSVRVINPSIGNIIPWTPIMGDSYIHIHTLQLKGLSAPLNSMFFREMVHLSIELPFPTSIVLRQTLGSLLEILESSPKIQTVKLCNLAIEVPESFVPPSKTIELPLLQNFTLCGEPLSTVTAIIQSIFIPADTHTKLDIQYTDPQDLKSSLPSLFYPGGPLANKISQATELVLITNPDQYKTVVTHENSDPDSSPLDLTFHGPALTKDQSFQSIQKLLNLTPQLSFIGFDSVHWYDMDQWAAVLTHRNLVGLKSLAMSADETQASFLSALSTVPFALPSLECLTIPSIPTSAITKNALVEHLRSRAEDGKGLLYLEIGSVYPVEREFMSSLEEHVAALHYTESV